MAVDLGRYGIRVRRFLIHRDRTFEPLGDEAPQGAWLWATILGGTVELYRDGPPPRRVRPAELLGLALVVGLICGVGLLVLPFVLTVLTVLLPIAAVGLLVRWLLRRRRP